MTADDNELPSTETSSSIVRSFVDVEHRHWTVQEIASSQYDRRGARDLIFSCSDVVRRVRNYPVDWYKLTDDELYALSFRP